MHENGENLYVKITVQVAMVKRGGEGESNQERERK